MNEFLVYLLNSTLSLSLLYLLFRIIMRNETFFKLNRVILLLIVLCSISIPILTSPFKTHNPVKVLAIPTIGSEELKQLDFAGIEKKENTEQTNNSRYSYWEFIPSILQVVLYTYLSGCLIALLILFYGLIRIGILYKEGQILLRKNFRLLIIDREISAFSFGRWLFISKSDYENHGKTILAHEQEHIRQNHFFDLILLEILKIIHWFNPVIYWLIRDMKDIHEFQADTYALTTGIDVTQYQLLIIQKGVGSQRFALANSFNQFQIKKRITMMNKQKSSKTPVWKIAVFLPLLALLLTAFGREIPNSPLINSKLAINEDQLKTNILPQVKESKMIDNHSSNEEINYTADDKIVLEKHSKKILMYENAQVSYRNVKISADFIELDRRDSTVYAKGNSIFKKEDKEIKAYEIKCNLATGKIEIKDEQNKKYFELSQNIPLIDDVKFIYNVVDEVPQYPGGIEEMMKFIMENIKYTELAKKDWAEGRVMVNFIINKNGKIEKARITHGVHPDLDAEALRVIGLLPTWKPGKQNGKAVDVFYTIPIEFKLEASEKKSQLNSNLKLQKNNHMENVELVNNKVQQKEDKSISKAVDENPQFHGGEKALWNFIRGKIRYPGEAARNNEQGKVIINFVIDRSGKVKNPIVFKGVSSSLDAEAIRVISLLPDWIPGKKNGKTVDASYTIPIEFKLEATEKKSVTQGATFPKWEVGHSIN